jgi:hypothetical protein
MGAKFSADAEDAQILIRDKNGQLILHTGKMNTTTSCSTLPIPLSSQEIGHNEQKVQYLFFPSTNYSGKNFHAHTFFDEDCDTPGNDKVIRETTVLNKKNINHVKQERTSNSTYFEINIDPINMPLYPQFSRKENGVLMPRYTKRSAYNNCTLIPYPAVKDRDKPVGINHNTVPMRLYTDDKCQNEYVNTLQDPGSFTKKHNVDNRVKPVNDETLTMKYTNIKSYVEPSVKTNARYYRTFREEYP